MSDYAAVRAAYLQGGRANSLPKLAAKFRIPLSTLEKRAAAEKWKAARQETGRIAAGQTAEIVARSLAEEAAAWVLESLRVARELRAEVFDARRGVQVKVMNGPAGPVRLELPLLNDAADLRAYVAALAAVDKLGRTTLGLDVQRVEVAAGAPAVEVGAAVADARLAAIVARADARDRLADRLVTFRGEDTDDEARAILASIVEATA